MIQKWEPMGPSIKGVFPKATCRLVIITGSARALLFPNKECIPAVIDESGAFYA